MHPGTDHHSVPFVQEDRGIVRVHAVEREREDAGPVARVRGSEQSQPRFSGQRAGDVVVEVPLLRLDLREADAAEVIESGVRPDRARVILEARLEPVGWRSELVVGETAPFYGLPAHEEGPQLGDRPRRGGEHPDSGRT